MTPNSEKLIHLFMSDFLVFIFELRLIELIEVKVT